MAESLDGEEDEWILERVLKTRFAHADEEEYLIQWKGYSPGEATWHSVYELDDYEIEGLEEAVQLCRSEAVAQRELAKFKKRKKKQLKAQEPVHQISKFEEARLRAQKLAARQLEEAKIKHEKDTAKKAKEEAERIALEAEQISRWNTQMDLYLVKLMQRFRSPISYSPEQTLLLEALQSPSQMIESLPVPQPRRAKSKIPRLSKLTLRFIAENLDLYEGFHYVPVDLKAKLYSYIARSGFLSLDQFNALLGEDQRLLDLSPFVKSLSPKHFQGLFRARETLEKLTVGRVDISFRLSWILPLNSLTHLVLQGAQIKRFSKSEFRLEEWLPHLQLVDFSHTRGMFGLDVFRNLKQLKTLNLNDCALVTPQTFVYPLLESPLLENLSCDNVSSTSAASTVWSESLAALEHISKQRTSLTLKKLTVTLRRLDSSGLRIFLKRLCEMSALSHVKLNEMTYEFLITLFNCTSLQSLELELPCRARCSAFESLKPLPYLHTLTIVGSGRTRLPAPLYKYLLEYTSLKSLTLSGFEMMGLELHLEPFRRPNFELKELRLVAMDISSRDRLVANLNQYERLKDDLDLYTMEFYGHLLPHTIPWDSITFARFPSVTHVDLSSSRWFDNVALRNLLTFEAFPSLTELRLEGTSLSFTREQGVLPYIFKSFPLLSALSIDTSQTQLELGDIPFENTLRLNSLTLWTTTHMLRDISNVNFGAFLRTFVFLSDFAVINPNPIKFLYFGPNNSRLKLGELLPVPNLRHLTMSNISLKLSMIWKFLKTNPRLKSIRYTVGRNTSQKEEGYLHAFTPSDIDEERSRLGYPIKTEFIEMLNERYDLGTHSPWKVPSPSKKT